MQNQYQIDQGTILYGVGSSKYPDVPCYGIIITASCDIANNKVSKYYYLLGVDVYDWLKSSHCLKYIFGSDIIKKIEEQTKIISKFELDADTLLKFNQDEVNKVIANNKPNDIKKIQNSLTILKKAKQISTISELNEISIKFEKKINNKLKEINQGREVHYYYLPQNAYKNN